MSNGKAKRMKSWTGWCLVDRKSGISNGSASDERPGKPAFSWDRNARVRVTEIPTPKAAPGKRGNSTALRAAGGGA